MDKTIFTAESLSTDEMKVTRPITMSANIVRHGLRLGLAVAVSCLTLPSFAADPARPVCALRRAGGRDRELADADGECFDRRIWC